MGSDESSTINNKYNVLEAKGKGASAVVYLVESMDNNKNKKYAAKVLKEVTPSFEREISILEKLSKLKCPYLVNLIEFGEGPVKIGSKSIKTKQYIILDYASKGKIFDYISCTQKGLSEIHAKFMFKKILEGVQSCHLSGICHRDLKLHNILLDNDFNPKICDFGFATEIKGKDGSGKLTDYLGTLNYAAPEIFLHKPYDGVKADIFSLGVVLINLVTSKLGFIQANRNDKYYRYIILKQYEAYWNKVKRQLGEISEELKNLYFKMISFNPDERPSIEEVFNHPWMKEVMNMNETELKELQKDVFNDFEKREKTIISSHEVLESSSSSDIFQEIEYEKECFAQDLNPKHYEKTGFNMNYYMKNMGNLKPVNFMNT